MLKSVAVRVFAALLIVAMAGAGQATAGIPGEVAHSSMGGSTLMPTTAQFNSWTHWVVNHDNFVELSVGDGAFYGPVKDYGAGRGQAALHWKYNDNNHLLFRVRQFDLGGQNSNFVWGGTLENFFLSPAMLTDMIAVSNYNAYAEGQMLNLAWAKPMASGGAFSIGVLYADAGYKYEDNDGEANDKSGAFGAQVTWGNGNGFDLAASFHSQSSTFGPSDAEDENSFTHFDLTARIDRGNGWVYQLGALMGSGSIEEFEEEAFDVSLMGLTANVGRHLLSTDTGAVTTEFFVNYFSLKGEEGDFENTTSSLVVPGTRVAAWTQISKRFQVMAGANAYWGISKDKVTAGSDEETESERGMTFSYSGGLAFVPNDAVRIEGQLEMDRLNNLLSLGNDTPLLARVGATFAF